MPDSHGSHKFADGRVARFFWSTSHTAPDDCKWCKANLCRQKVILISEWTPDDPDAPNLIVHCGPEEFQ